MLALTVLRAKRSGALAGAWKSWVEEAGGAWG